MPRPANDRRIVLLGSSGQLGSELRHWLGSLGHVLCPRRTQADLARADQLRAFVREARPHLIINAAGYTAVDAAESDEAGARAVNAVAPGVLAEEAQRIGAALVHYSSDYIFDGSGTQPWRETDDARPLNVYGRTKLAGEQAIAATGVPHLILRTSWVYAARGMNFVTIMLRLGSAREQLRVVDDQIGAPTSARVVACLTAKVLARAEGDFRGFLNEFGRLVHFCCGGATSRYDWAQEIFRLARAAGMPLAVREVIPISSADYPTAARRPLNSRLDCTLLWRRFGIRPPHWRAALTETLNRIASNASAAEPLGHPHDQPLHDEPRLEPAGPLQLQVGVQ